MSHAERTRTKRPHEQEPLKVGAADDVAEVDADRRADEALGWLAAQRPMDQAPPEAHVHSPACDVGRKHAPQAEGTIGYEGGALDAGTQAEIQGAVGGGRPLAPDVRGPMEQAFGADLGRVRVHDGSQADRVSRSISAEAFTTGNDIFFSRGAYAPTSPQGQRVLAHEIGHVMQNRGGVKRLWNPFKKKEKSDVAKARDTNKVMDKQVRSNAKKVNADHKKLSENIKLSYETAPNAKLLKPNQLVAVEQLFAATLVKEQQARERVMQQNVGSDDAEALADKAAEAVWQSAPDEIRALRPLRFDEFDVALNEVRQLAQEGRAQLQGETSMKLNQNEHDLGAVMDPEKAQKKVLEQRKLDRAQVRANPDLGGLKQKTDAKGDKAVAKAGKHGPVGPRQETRLRSNAVTKKQEESYAPDETMDDVNGYLQTGSTVVDKGGKLGKGIATAVGTDVSKDVGSVLGYSTGGLGQILSMISDILTFVGTVTEIRRGTADRGAKVQAASEATQILKTASEATKSTLLAAKEGVEQFGGISTVASQAGSAIPIVGIITSALGIIQNTIDLVPLGERHSGGIVTVQQALLSGKAPLAASYDRVNSRNAQLIEKQTFSLAKNSTMLGLNIAEVASAGGFAIPLAAKLTVTITDLCHTLGHKIYDTVNESKSSTALTNFKVKHKEGASRDVLKYDIGSSVDVIIVAAQKHKLGYARETLLQYGVTESEIDSMWLQELREKVLDGLDAEGDPKTVGEKIDAAKDSVKSALGIEKGPVGMKPETTAWEDVKAVPGKIVDGFKAIPKAIAAKRQSIKDAWADAEMIVKNKNATGHNGRNDREGGSKAFYFLRGADKNEKSLQKVRQTMADRGTEHADLPRTTDDRKKRAEIETAKQVKADPNISGPVAIDQAFLKKVSAASAAELYDIISGINQKPPIAPSDLAKLSFIEMEVAARLQPATGGTKKK